MIVDLHPAEGEAPPRPLVPPLVSVNSSSIVILAS